MKNIFLSRLELLCSSDINARTLRIHSLQSHVELYDEDMHTTQNTLWRKRIYTLYSLVSIVKTTQSMYATKTRDLRPYHCGMLTAHVSSS